VSILVPRTRTLGVRLSADEYAALEKFCVDSGARSISDLARAAICSFIQGADRESVLASTLDQNVAQVKNLEQRIVALTAEIQLLKPPANEIAAKVNEDVLSLDSELLSDVPDYDPGL
jgi:uncharacterized small protein (DUF1192 family)